MAARSRKQFHDDETRRKIQSSQLINRLQDHIFNGTEMSKTQVSAALGLLKKTIPDLQSVDLSGDVTVRHEEALEELE